MVNGAHAILYSDDANATRAALAEVLGARSVDAVRLLAEWVEVFVATMVRWCPVRLERSLFVEGAAVAGESVEDLLGALVPAKGRGLSFQWLELSG